MKALYYKSTRLVRPVNDPLGIEVMALLYSLLQVSDVRNSVGFKSTGVRASEIKTSIEKFQGHHRCLRIRIITKYSMYHDK